MVSQISLHMKGRFHHGTQTTNDNTINIMLKGPPQLSETNSMKESSSLSENSSVGTLPKRGIKRHQFLAGFMHGIRDVLIITFVLFLIFLSKVLAIPFAVMIIPFVSYLSGNGQSASLELGAALVYLLIAFGLNVGFKIMLWAGKGRLSDLDTFGNVMGSLVTALIISPFALSLALYGFGLFLGPQTL
jgi:hypothetical protein